MQRNLLAASAALALAVTASGAQTLTLGDALGRAERSAYPTRIARGQSAASAGQSVGALRGILPTLRFEGSFLRTTDPLNAFGFALRQRSVTLASFDPLSLNRPAPIGNTATGVVMEMPLFNADAWLGRKAAVEAHEAATASESWTRESVAFDVAQAYYGALLAAERVTTLQSALIAAQAHVRQAESLLRNGAVTRSDALIASIREGDAEAMLIDAKSGLDLSHQRLAVAIGSPDDSSWTLPSTLPAASAIRSLLERAAADSARAPRGDVRAASLASDAARADLGRARSLYVPRLNSFGRVDYNTPSTAFGGADSWTVGVMLSWSPFSGASEIGEIQAARGRSNAASAAAEAAAAKARLDIREADAALHVALARLDIAERAVEQSAEAHRIVSRKYDGGLATVVELFDAAAIETQSRMAFAEARFQAIAAAAGRLRALGLALTPITTLDR